MTTATLYDINGTPLRKQPDCPRCGEDEIGSSFDNAWCHRCGWRGSLVALLTLLTERANNPQSRVTYP